MTARSHDSDLSLTFSDLAPHLERLDEAGARSVLLRDFQRRRDRGPNPRVEDYIQAWPALAERRELLLDLIVQEMLSREGDGEGLVAAEYEARFPELAAPLRRQAELLRLIAGQETAPPGAAGEEGDPSRPTHAESPEDRARASQASAAEPGVSVPGYEILGLLGKGGMGVVYKARHLRLNRVVALKMVLGGAHATADELARFLSEAESLAAVHHPNVVQVYDSGQHDGLPFIALEFVPGGSLASRLEEGPLPSAKAARLVEQIARGVEAAHANGIVHRDLKPGNVLLAEDGTAKVTDFGLAKRIEGEGGLTATGAVMGTPSYMAPEQARGEGRQVGPAADVWALGAVLYECLTGRPPFKAATSFETMVQVLAQEPVAVRQLQPLVPADLETICHKCLQKDVPKRYRNAAALADDLRRFSHHEPIAARPVGWAERGWRWCRRNPAVAALLTTVAAVMLVGTSLSTGLLVYAAAQTQRAEWEGGLREQADGARLQAEAEQLKAQAAEARAKEEEELKKRSLYVAHLLRVEAVFERDPEQGLNLLYDDNACPLDLRETAWHYFERGCSRWERATLVGHNGPVRSVDFSPDGLTLATGTGFGEARVWDLKTGRCMATLQGIAAGVVEFSPDGLTLASGSGGGIVRLWDVRTCQHRATLEGHTHNVESVAFSPDGLTLASAAEDKTVRLWDVTTGQQKSTLLGHKETVRSVAFSPDGLTLASGSHDGTVRLWDVKTAQQKASLAVPTSNANSVAYSPDGLTLASGGGGSDKIVRLWDTRTGQVKATLSGHTGAIISVAYSPDGLTLASGSSDKTVRLWDAKTGHPKVTLRGHPDYVQSVAFSPDGETLASGCQDGAVRLWDIKTEQAAATLQGHTGGVTSTAFSPDGETLATGSEDKTVRLWDARTGRLKAKLVGHANRVFDLAFSPDGLTLASGSTVLSSSRDPNPDHAEVRLWDFKSGEAKATLKWGAQGTGTPPFTGAGAFLEFTPDGQTLAWGSLTAALLWDVRTWQPKDPFGQTPFRFSSGAMSPDGETIAFGTEDTKVLVCDTKTGRHKATLSGHTGPVTDRCAKKVTPDAAIE